jgi:hypothetical protein
MSVLIDDLFVKTPANGRPSETTSHDRSQIRIVCFFKKILNWSFLSLDKTDAPDVDTCTSTDWQDSWNQGTKGDNTILPNSSPSLLPAPISETIVMHLSLCVNFFLSS